jgi:mRNA-degrading endonuclease RelE of RelBE toxin-antitoxin system
VKIRRTKTFDKTFLKLPAQVQLKTEKAVKLLLLDFYHPSLHTKKMIGQKDIWEARVDYHYRFTFTFDHDTIILRVVGNHEDALKNP